jgi:predicted GTPase
VESLKQGIIKTSNSKVKVEYTILLVGGTGVGKSSIVGFIANALLDNDINHYDFGILDHTNEQGGSGSQSQTQGAHLYEFTSNSGTVVSYSVLAPSG